MSISNLIITRFPFQTVLVILHVFFVSVFILSSVGTKKKHVTVRYDIVYEHKKQNHANCVCSLLDISCLHLKGVMFYFLQDKLPVSVRKSECAFDTTTNSACNITIVYHFSYLPFSLSCQVTRTLIFVMKRTLFPNCYFVFILFQNT